MSARTKLLTNDDLPTNIDGVRSRPDPQTPRPYLSAAQLADLTPWSLDAIEKMIRRNVFRRGEHYFQLERRGRLIFRWESIVELIEGGATRRLPETPVDGATQRMALGDTQGIDVDKATTELRRLLD